MTVSVLVQTSYKDPYKDSTTIRLSLLVQGFRLCGFGVVGFR